MQELCENRFCSLLLFEAREINRFLEIYHRDPRKILRASRNSILETRASNLDTRFSIASRIEDRVSSRDCQLTFARYCTYQDMSCRIAHAGQMSDRFEVRTGVRQGYLLSPFLFLLVIDWIMKITTTGRNNGIQWTLWTQLDDLDFADDLVLLPQPDAGQDHSPGDHISQDRA